ncbi:MAG: hypothetical protein RR789_08710 [Clostridium sp.]
MWKKVLIGGILIIGLTVYFFGFALRGRDITGLINVSSEGETINLDLYPKSFYGLEEILDKYNIYLMGENRGSKASYELNKYMAKYFVENKGVKYIVIDSGHSYAQYLNKYLETGDKKILEFLLQHIPESTDGMRVSQDEIELMRFYYELNSNLPQDKKIKFVGIGVESATVISLNYLNSILQNKNIDPEIKPFIDKIKESKNSPKFFTEDINHYFKNYGSKIKSSLGKDYFDFKIVIDNLQGAFAGSLYDKTLMNNFKGQYANLPEGKYYGQLGMFHTDNMKNFDSSITNSSYSSFAHDLNIGFNQTRGKVFTLNYLYSGGKELYSNMPQNNDDLIAFPRILGTSYKIYNSTRDYKAFTTIKSWTQGKFADEWFVIINNSPAAGRYKNQFTLK